MTDNTQANTRNQHDSIDFDQVRELEPGNAVAVRAVHNQRTTILAGEIERITSNDPENVFEEPLTEHRPDDPVTYHSLVYINADIWWKLDDNEMTDLSDRLQDRPPTQPDLGEPPMDAPLCSLAVGSNRRVALVIPTPESNGSRIVSYYPGPFRPVVKCVSGSLIEPTRVLPETHDPPESSSQ